MKTNTTRRRLVAGAFLMALFAGTAARTPAADSAGAPPPPKAEGTWKWTFTMPDGTKASPRAKLKREGNVLTGKSLVGTGTEVAISDGRVDGDLVSWSVVREHGLICSMGYGGGGSIRDGLNNPANHTRIVDNLIAAMPKAAALGVPNLITFFGNRQGRGDREAADNCVTALTRLKGAAEQHGVTVCVELLNSKVDHADYQGDRTPFGVEVVAAVNSPRVKLLYDIYHMQIMEGDVIRTIRQHHAHIAHYHTGGVPGRHELDDTQELQWPTICRAIADTGFTGYLAHEFVPTRDPMTSLREAVVLCDV